jgi:hypothetical protein
MTTSCQIIILPTCVQNKSKQTEKGGVNRDESLPVIDVTIYSPLPAMYDVLLQTCLGAF